MIDIPFKMKREGTGTSNFIPFSFFLCVCVCVCVFCCCCFVCYKKCPMLSCFINCVFNSFEISYWMYFVVIERKKKKHLVSCTNTHHDVTGLVNHGMVKNTKTGISGGQNITFLQNRKIS